jgi:phosphatidylserine synthase
MILTSVFAIILATLRPNPFLLLIGIFSLYLTVSGQRMVRYQEYQSKLSQKILLGVSAVAATGLIMYSIYLLINLKSFGLVPLTFGLIMLTLIRQEMLLKNISFAKRVQLHIGRIAGAYIAALTAFLVVNNTVLPGWLAWLLPTAIIVPLILRWSKLYQDKKSDIQT